MNKKQLVETLLNTVFARLNSDHEESMQAWALEEEDLDALGHACSHVYNLGKISMLSEIDKREFLLEDWLKHGRSLKCPDYIHELMVKTEEALTAELVEDTK